MCPIPSDSGPLEVVVRSESETDRLGALLADALEPGTVVALVGNLGAGKTRLVRAVAIAAGVDPREINSPTFVLVHEYEGRWQIYHFDTYRLQNPDEFLDLGALDYFASGGICFVEWADRVPQALPVDHLRIEIETIGETERMFRISAGGATARRAVDRLSQHLRSTN